MDRKLVAFLWFAKAWPPPFPDPSLLGPCITPVPPVPRANDSTVLTARKCSKELPGSGWWEDTRLPD